MVKATYGRTRLGEKGGQAEISLDLVHKNCSGYARQKVGPKMMNYCKLEQVGTKEHGKILKRIQVLEEGRVKAKEAKKMRISRTKEKVHKKRLQKVVE